MGKILCLHWDTVRFLSQATAGSQSGQGSSFYRSYRHILILIIKPCRLSHYSLGFNWTSLPNFSPSSFLKTLFQYSSLKSVSYRFTNSLKNCQTSLNNIHKLLLLFSHAAVSNSVQPHGLWPTRLLCLLDSPGKNTGMGCHSLLPRIASAYSLITTFCFMLF